MNDFFIFYSEPGYPFWRCLPTHSPFSALQVAKHFVQDFEEWVIPNGLADKLPEFVMVRGFCLN